MGIVLFAWELGDGLGHLMRVAPLAQTLRQRGHRVFAALRDLTRAAAIVGEAAELLQSPVKVGRPASPFHPVYTFAHILHNVGYADPQELFGLAQGWRTLLEVIDPHVIICDQSPTALIASRGLPIRRIVIGHGFFCVPDQYPLPNLRSWEPVETARFQREEDVICDRINQLLERWQSPQLERIGQLYSDADDTFLTTFEELDHIRAARRNCAIEARRCQKVATTGMAIRQWQADLRLFKKFSRATAFVGHLKQLELSNAYLR